MVVKRAGALALLLLAACMTPAPHPSDQPPAGPAVLAKLDTPPTALRPAPAPAPRPAPSAAPEAAAADTGSMDDRLDRLFAEDSRAQQALDPLGAMARGEAVPQDLLALVFTPALTERQRVVIQHTLAQLDRIDPRALDDAHHLSYDVFRRALDDQRALLDPWGQFGMGVKSYVKGFARRSLQAQPNSSACWKSAALRAASTSQRIWPAGDMTARFPEHSALRGAVPVRDEI